jgi:TonB family protein
MIERRSAITSLSIHILAVVLLFSLVTYRTTTLPVANFTPLHAPLLPPYRGKQGGGSQPEKGPVQAGRLPTRSTRVFVPMLLTPVNLHPKLAMVATIDAPPDIDSKLPNFGDPNGLASLLPGGSGGRGGIGIGTGTTFGPGPGSGAPGISGVYTSGHGITMPVAIKKVEPEFSEEARRARAMGIVVVYAEIGTDGKPHNLRVVRSFGMGLDEKAVEAVQQWLFRPGTKDGKPVTVAASIELAFHLL